MSVYQDQVMRWLQGQAAAPSADPRWQIYDDAYLGRLATALSGTILERVSMLFGENFVQGLLCAFIRAVPPLHPIMPEILHSFPSWLREQGWYATHPELVELVELSLGCWSVLNGEDPPCIPHGFDAEEMGTLTLQSNHVLFLSALPLYDLWTGEPGIILPEAQGVLFYKTSPIVLESVMIARELFDFARSLSQGLNLFDALQHETDVKKLPELIRYLISTGAFIAK